jgi:hypothetical protein
MVRLVLLLTGACCAAAPAAQAGVVPVDLQSATTAVQQDPVATTVTSAGAVVTSAVGPAVERLDTQAAGTTGTSTTGTVETTKELTAPPQYTVAVAGPTPAGENGETSEPRADGSTISAKGRSRAPRRAHGRTDSSAASGGHRAALAPPSAQAAGPLADAPRRAVGDAPHQAAAASEPRPDSPRPEAPSHGGEPASSPAAGIALGGLALLTIVLCLAGPRLRQRLEIRPGAARPVAFVSLLERPG